MGLGKSFFKGVSKVISGGGDLLLRGAAKGTYHTVGAGFEIANGGLAVANTVRKGAVKGFMRKLDPDEINDFGELIVGHRLKKGASRAALAIAVGGGIAVTAGKDRRRGEMGEILDAQDSHSMIMPTARSNKQYTEETVKKDIMNNGAEADIVFALHNKR